MTDEGHTLRNISDTARWVAIYRAQETERRDAVFRDPFARRLAGERGEAIHRAMPIADRDSWAFVARTLLFDEIIAREVAAGADMVLNLAAGLDARPYRMELPASLRWIEVDLPEILDYKEEVLRDERPRCALERVRLDLADVDARRALFERVGRAATHVLALTEGLIVYLTADEAAGLARDLAAPPSFRRWALDLASPPLLEMLQRRWGGQLDRAAAPLKFAPAEGPGFFEPSGWRPVEVHSVVKTAGRIRRGPLMVRFFALFPESAEARRIRPWQGICLMERS